MADQLRAVPDMPHPIITHLRDIRTGHGHTQQWVAERLGVTDAAVAMWENGRRQISVAMAARYANLFGYDVGLACRAHIEETQ